MKWFPGITIPLDPQGHKDYVMECEDWVKGRPIQDYEVISGNDIEVTAHAKLGNFDVAFWVKGLAPGARATVTIRVKCAPDASFEGSPQFQDDRSVVFFGVHQ